MDLRLQHILSFLIDFRLILKVLFVDGIHLGLVMRSYGTYIQIYFYWFFIIQLFVWLLSEWLLYFSLFFVKKLLFYWLYWSLVFSLIILFYFHILNVKIFFHTSLFNGTWLQHKLVFLLLIELSLEFICKWLCFNLVLRNLIWLIYIKSR